MRMTVGQLRRIVREALEAGLVREAPLSDDPILTVDARTESGKAAFAPDLLRKIERFFGNSNYRNKAEYTLRMFPQEVILINGVIDSEEHRFDNPITSNARVTVYKTDAGIEMLKSIGVSSDPAYFQRLRSKLDSGATVFVNATGGMTRGERPTPWMMIHAIFDNGDYSFKPAYKIRDAVFRIYTNGGIGYKDLIRHATMKSARDNNIVGEDIVAEMIVQSIVDSRGLTFKKSDDPEINRKLTALKNEIDALDIRKRFHKAVKGKVIGVGTGTLA